VDLRIGIIGAGVMGADHAKTIAGQVARAHVAAICDADLARAQAAASAIAGARVADDPLALIRDPGIDAVVVASPDETHATYTLACIDAGKPVLCEKPLAPNLADCLRVVEAERAAGRRLVQVGFMRRFDPAYQDMKDRFAAGDLGEALMLHCAHRNATAPGFFKSLMAITNSAVHEFDIVRWLLDAEIVKIQVMKGRSTRATDVADPLLIVMRTDRDQLVDVEVFIRAAYGYDIRTELVCEKGTLTMAPPVRAELRAEGRHAFPFAADWRPRFADAYRRQMQAWVDSIASGRPAGAGAWDGLVATAIADAGCAALETGRPQAVKLPDRPRA
jgi:myo-inositol 2-dehydrogenase/D-chiro-inositol 1-dehydrogenase